MELFRWLGLGESEESKEKRIESVRNQVLSSPEILGKILEKLDQPRRKGSRLTCTLWNRVICGLYQKESRRSQAEICSEKAVAKLRAAMESHKDLDPHPFPYISLQIYPDMSAEDSTWLCSNFKIVGLTLNQYGVALSPESAKVAMSILKSSASTLTSLSIPFLESWDEKDDDNQKPGLHFPKLEVVNPFPRYYGPGVPAPDPQEQVEFFKRIISSSPRLQSMSLSPGLSGLLEQSLSFSTIRKLSLTEGSWDPLGSDKFRNLKELTWKFRDYKEPPQVSQALSRFSNSLRRLYITWDYGPESKHPTSFPLLSALTLLEVDLLLLDDVSWENLPNLRYLRFKRIRDFELSSKPDFRACPSVRKVSYRGDRIRWGKTVACSREMERFFPKLFQRFPGARDWKVHHKDVIPFCKAAKAMELRVRKFSVYLGDRSDCNGDEDVTYFIDRYTFSLLPNLQELEELVLDNGDGWGSQMRLSEIEFPKLTKLKRLKVYNYNDPAPKECEALEGIPMVQACIFRSSQLGKALLSAPNVEFRQVPVKRHWN